MFHDEASSSSAPGSDSFQPNGLIWAKMKGFPPWPAKVLAQTEDTPAGRIPVMFFGTKETGFMKASDCSDYMSNKHQYEVPRKHKVAEMYQKGAGFQGFNDGVHEIRVEAGIEEPSYRDPVFFSPQESSKLFPPVTEDGGRVRRNSSRFNDNFLTDIIRKRSNSGSAKTRSRASSTPSTLKFLLHKQLTKRRRLDSESSNGSRRRQMISGGLNTGMGSDPMNSLYDLALIADADNHWNLHDSDNFLGLSDDARSTRSKRSRGASKVYDNFLIGSDGISTRNRNRSSSQSDSKRTRLISGVSDTFLDELFASGGSDLHAAAAAADFMNTLDEMPSESSEIFPNLMERDGTPEAPAPLPRPAEFCRSCGCECTLVRNKWLCNSRFCKEWCFRGNREEPFMEASTSSSSNNLNHDQVMKQEPAEESLGNNHLTKGEGMVMTNKAKKEEKKKSTKLKTKKETESPKRTAKERIREEFSKDSRLLSLSVAKEKKKVQVISPRQISLSPPTSPTIKVLKEDDVESPSRDKRTQGRPKQYKVEMTPPVGKNGLRHCSFCSGQVRPQMCGGNKHRWRCVDKKCRKWYGWVKASDQIPNDLGRKGRHNSVLGKIKLKKKVEKVEKVPLRVRKVTEKTDIGSISSAGEAAQAAAHLDTASLLSGTTGRSSPARAVFYTLAEMKKKLAAEALKKSKSTKVVPQPKAPAIKKKKVVAKKEVPEIKEEPDLPQRSVSPLTQRESRYRPCGMEKRARWWISEKRRADPSPERELPTTMADAAAAFRVLSHAFRAAAVTRADEVGTVNGSLDLMMDSLLGCMGPLLSLLSKLPNTRPDPEVTQKLWDASAVHIPIFQ